MTTGSLLRTCGFPSPDTWACNLMQPCFLHADMLYSHSDAATLFYPSAPCNRLQKHYSDPSGSLFFFLLLPSLGMVALPLGGRGGHLLAGLHLDLEPLVVLLIIHRAHRRAVTFTHPNKQAAGGNHHKDPPRTLPLDKREGSERGAGCQVISLPTKKTCTPASQPGPLTVELLLILDVEHV